MRLYDRIINPALLVRRIYLTANDLIPELEVKQKETWEQLDLFTDYTAIEEQKKEDTALWNGKRKCNRPCWILRKKFGKNAILKGMNFLDGATAKDRNGQIGGHKA